MTLHIKSPLIHSLKLSKLTGVDIYLKLELLQPSGSYKDRGIGYMCKILKERGAKHLVSSSGGNAGHSAAHAGRLLEMPVKVIVPSTTKKNMLDLIRAQGAHVEVFGDNWNAADEKARALVQQDETAAYIPPFDDPLLWEGNSTIIDEIRSSDIRPKAIVVSVGGGGLLCGVYKGLERYSWNDVSVIAVETEGAASFKSSFDAKKIVRLEGIHSIATSLGTLEVTPQALQYAQQFTTVSQTVSDAEAVDACSRFLADHRMLVEPACGAALAMAYSPEKSKLLTTYSPVVIVVCGGSGVTVDYLLDWERQFSS